MIRAVRDVTVVLPERGRTEVKKTVILAALALGALLGALATVLINAHDPASQARIAVRHLSTGYSEFVIQVHETQGWKDLRPFPNRYVHRDAEVGKWFYSSQVYLPVRSVQGQGDELTLDPDPPSTPVLTRSQIRITRTTIGFDRIGWPEVNMSVENSSGRKIKAMKYELIVWNAFGEALGCSSRSKVHHYTQSFRNPKGSRFTISADPSCTRTADRAWARVYEVAFEDGSKWKDPAWDVYRFTDQTCAPGESGTYIYPTNGFECRWEN